MRLEFTTEDPLITLLINKIQEYDSIQGHPPSELEDLIPGYLKTIPMPDSVEKIEYSFDKSNNSWVLTYYVKTGTVCDYKAMARSWGCSVMPESTR
jgi:hypothetical protein